MWHDQATWDKPDDVHLTIGTASAHRSDGESSGNGSAPFTLSGTCSFKHNGITVVIGPVGSGKSTLLMSLLGETKVVQGSIGIVSRCMGYSADDGSVAPATIKENIVFGRLFARACCSL